LNSAIHCSSVLRISVAALPARDGKLPTRDSDSKRTASTATAIVCLDIIGAT